MATHRQTMTYNAMSRPETITENNHTIEFSYNGRGERVYSRFYEKDNTNPVLGTVITDLERRYYLGNIYERHINEDGEEKIILYLGGDAYSAPAAFVMDEEYGPHMAYICRDNLGSITHVISDQYTKEYSYDAWGNLRDPESHALCIPNRTQDMLYLGRGYTGHEHHGYFGLINMNARMYEPIMGRFISPDPFVQMSDNSQNFNRYTYCLNNPLRYTDESGEIFFSIINAVKDLFVNTFINVWSQGINAWTNGDNWHSTQMAFKIDMGLFQGNLKQIISRFTWELPQTFLGYEFAQGLNFFNDVKSVTYYGGATAVERYKHPDGWAPWNQKLGSAVTLGSFITGDRGLQADPYNSLFQHEYGHYLQSQIWGPRYIGKVGVPSLLNTGSDYEHSFYPIEQDANARAFEYFNKNVNGFYKTKKQYDSKDIGWDFSINPLNLNNKNGYKYVDYKKQMSDVRNLRESFRFSDILPITNIPLGLYNHIRYNQTKVRRY